MKKVYFLVLAICMGVIVFLFLTKKGKQVKNFMVSYITEPKYVKDEGVTVSSRVLLPEGFVRKSYPENSFSRFIQHYALKPHTAKVINYDGREYVYQAGHIGVLDLSVPANGLQQCADALIRLRVEYLWEQNRKDEIGFNFTSGHYCSWKKYAEGFRPKINGNKVSFHKTATADYSKENLYRYLNLIYLYAGTLSLYHELPQINSVADIEVGDMLIYPGSPGHVVMVVDKATHANGKNLFIFAQGNTPAQSVHMLKNFNDRSINPWYELEMDEPLQIPTYLFTNVQFIRFH